MNKYEPLLLLLGGANPQQGIACIRQARASGLRIWLTDTEENLQHAPEIVASVDEVTALSYHSAEACVAWAKEQHKKTPFIGVFGFREYAVEAVAAVAEALGLPGNPLSQVRLVRNKQACRRALAERGFRQPASALCSNLSEAQAFLATHPRGPWIMKPPAAMGSVGVQLIPDAAALPDALEYLSTSCQALAKKFHRQGIIEEGLLHAGQNPVLMESFQHGQEFSAEGLFVSGQPHILAITEKKTYESLHFIESGHCMPAHLDSTVEQTIKQTLSSALVALKLRWGLFHVEFWLDDGYPVLGEVHVRSGGDSIHYMTEYITGTQLYKFIFDQMLGHPINLTDCQPHCGAAIRFLSFPIGQVKAISGWESVVAHPGCLLAELDVKVGDYVNPILSSGHRPGFVLVTAPTSQEAVALAEQFISSVQVDIRADV